MCEGLGSIHIKGAGEERRGERGEVRGGPGEGGGTLLYIVHTVKHQEYRRDNDTFPSTGGLWRV